MRTLTLAAAALGCAGLAQAQDVAQATYTDAVPQFKGTYYMETGQFVPADQGPLGSAGVCGEGLTYNNSAVSGFFFDGEGATLLSNGQMPTVAPGTQTDYEIRGFEVSYATDQLSTDFDILFWANGAGCADFAALGAFTAGFTVSGAPGSSTLGTIEVNTIYVNLGVLAFSLPGDGNGVNGDADGDRFGWGIRFPQGLDGVSVCGPMLASDPDVCPAGSGTFADTLGCDGAGTGSGLSTTDAFVREADGLSGAGCFFFGGYPANPYASFYLKTSSSSPGDDCNNAIDLGSALVTDLGFDTTCNSTSGFDGGALCGSGASSINQDVFYVWTAPADGDYEFDTQGSSFDTKLSVHAGGDCAATCAGYNDDDGGLQSTVALSGVLAGDVYLIQVGGFGSNAGMGDLTIEAFIDPCDVLPDDSFEDNDDCGMEASVADGTYTGLTVSKTDWDYYSLLVGDGDTLTVDLAFIHADGDMDMFLYEAGACADFASGNVGTVGSLAFGFSASDNETLSWTNTTGSTQCYTLKVNVYPPTSTGDCNTYDMTIDGTVDNVGTSFCSPANPNSTGKPGKSIAVGSSVAADNNLTIVSFDLPDSEFGYLVNSMNTGSSAVGAGILCLGAGKGRHIFQIQNSGLAGTISTPLNLTMLPRSTGPVSVVAGETWYFQLWHRDHGGVSNFTDAVCVTFN